MSPLQGKKTSKSPMDKSKRHSLRFVCNTGGNKAVAGAMYDQIYNSIR